MSRTWWRQKGQPRAETGKGEGNATNLDGEKVRLESHDTGSTVEQHGALSTRELGIVFQAGWAPFFREGERTVVGDAKVWVGLILPSVFAIVEVILPVPRACLLKFVVDDFAPHLLSVKEVPPPQLR